MIKTTHNTNTIHDTTEFLNGYFKHIDLFHDSLYYEKDHNDYYILSNYCNLSFKYLGGP